PANDWESKLYSKFVEFFNTGGDSAYTLNSLLGLQGNILVSRQSLRLLLLQTRQSLLRQLAIFTPMIPQSMGYEDTAEDIARELLDGLNSLPVECVATNGPLLVQKVRFVAVHLMDSPNAGPGNEDNQASCLSSASSRECIPSARSSRCSEGFGEVTHEEGGIISG
ncbi:hypothetical protein C369_07369, partial [Cryptococcus neoformans A5-35-17]